MLGILDQYRLEYLLLLSAYQFNLKIAEGFSYLGISNYTLQFPMTLFWSHDFG